MHESGIEKGMSLDALKYQDAKEKINLAYAARITNPPEYEESYSGVCDVDNAEQARNMADTLRENRNDPDRKIMIGVMTHPIVLNPNIPIPEEVREDICKEFPDKEELSAGFTDDPDVLNTIHYADLYGPNGPRKTGEAENLLENLELCVRYGGENLHAIQLDVTWPNPEEIKKFKELHPNILIILQIGKFALNEVNNDPQDMTDKLRTYGDSIDFALLDLSMGKGRKMTEIDITKLIRLLSMIQYECPDLGLVVAGGFGRKLEPGDPQGTLDPMDALKRIATEFPNISIDAQGGLKPADAPIDRSGHFLATTPADPEKAENYLEVTSDILDKKKDNKPGRNKPSYIRL